MFDYTVLFVDDEKNILKALRRSLRNEPYDQIFVTSSQEAMKIVHSRPVAVVVSDIRLKDQSGIELLKKINQFNPKIQKIALTGIDVMEDVVDIFDQVELYKYYTKPWNIEHLKENLLECIDIYKALTEGD